MSQPWRDPGTDLETRVAAFMASLSDAEVAAVSLGDFASFVARGVPEPHYVDAGSGLRGVAGATAFPAGIALAATFDPELAQAYGAAVGAEAKRAGFTVLLGPTVDLARDPVAGRIPEAFGEDPWLAGELGAAHVRGAQRFVVCQVKHFVAYTTEKRRTGHGLGHSRGDAVEVLAAEPLLHDTYLRPFEAVVRAGAWSLMGSYNRLNGEYVCQSAVLEWPRKYWGWQGFYCPDFIFAVRDPAEAMSAGLDLGALGGDGGRTPAIVARYRQVARRAAANVARAMFAVGLVDDPPQAPGPASNPKHQDLAQRVVVASSVLLRNEGLLPLSPKETVAIIGPADQGIIPVVGGSAAVTLSPERVTSPLAAIAARAKVSVVDGFWGDAVLPTIPASAFTLPDGSGPGVEVEFSDGERTWLEHLPRIDFTVDHARPTQAWPKRWRTRLSAEVSGQHRLSLTLGGFARLRIDQREVLAGGREVQQFIYGPHYPMQTLVNLEMGVPVELEISYEPGPAIIIEPMGLGPTLRLGWQPPDDRFIRAAKAASDADVAVVFVTVASGEGMDRDGLALPGDQEQLIYAVAAANPRTLVVVNAPGAVTMEWAEEVAAILHVWYPGERYGQALAAMLYGDSSPGGRLPLTIPFERADLPGCVAPGEVPTRLDYDADDGIGYRAAAVVDRGARFPFGFGLSYAATRASVYTDSVAGGVRITVQAQNLGEHDTTHVAQLYAVFEGERARQLVGLLRIRLGAGGEGSASLILAATAFTRWDPGADASLPVPGRHRVIIATHSADPGTEVFISVTREGRVSLK